MESLQTADNSLPVFEVLPNTLFRQLKASLWLLQTRFPAGVSKRRHSRSWPLGGRPQEKVEEGRSRCGLT